MRVFVISKKTLLAVLAAVFALIAAILIAALSGGGEKADKPNTGDTGDRSEIAENHDGLKINEPEQYELEVMAGLMKEVPVYSVRRNDRKIALTIDAAWQDDKTPFILSTLKKYGIKATFFLCGFWVRDYPDMVKEIARQGHEIGNHSMTHPHMSRLTANGIESELKEFEALITPIIGERTRLFRAPFGEYNDTVVNTVRQNGYEIIQWDADTIDWKEERSAQTILDTVLSKLHGGAIILAHNNGYRIEQYLPALIESALAEGYEFVTVSELLLGGNTIVDVNGVQKPAD